MERAASDWVDLLLRAPPPAGVEEHALLGEVRARLFGIPRTATRLGRYEILGTLGQGGSARVLRARDPELQREVAIKVIHPAPGGVPTPGADARLAHEARTLARLVHPNVVAVYDVGRVPGLGGGVYVVMELVDGCDLAAWLAHPRAVAEILAVFRAAGRGLAAAHAMGLLHRDFKPHNVLIGSDARVRVADFGLSLARGDRRAATPSFAPVQGSWTATGNVVGTPMYMAPEQHRGEPLDERCDQYAFCFALREALWGRPSAEELSDPYAFKSTPPRLPALRGVAPRCVRAIERGLAPDPRARWPDMETLLAALAGGGRRRRLALVAGTLGLAVTGVALAGDRSPPPGPCGRDDPGLSRVWNAEVRATTVEAFAASAPTLAADVIGPIDARMQARARAWDEARAAACDAADPVALACLLERRDRSAALVARWQDGGMGAVVGARAAVEALDDPASCLVHDAAATPSAGDAEAIAIDALLATGRVDEAAARASQARARLTDGASRSSVALAIAIGRALAEVGDAEAAAQVLARGHEIAQRLDDRAGAIRTAGLLVTIVGTRLGRDDEADTWVRHAEAALARAGDPVAQRAWVERHLGHLAGARGQWQRAREHYARDAASVAESTGVGSLAHIQALDNVAAAELHLGRLSDALALARRVVAGKRRMLGDHHPDLALSLHNLAVAELEAGELAAAHADVDDALAIWRGLFGETNPDVALARYTLGAILLAQGEATAAEVELAASLDARRERLGAGHPDTLGTAIMLARARVRLGRLDDAIALLEDVVRIQDTPGQTRGDRRVVLRELEALRRDRDRIGRTAPAGSP